MKPVRVRFACKPDALVRRRIISVGEMMPAGQTRSFVFRGYLCKLAADRDVCIADVIDAPIRLLGFRGPQWRAGVFSPLGYTVAGKRADYAPSAVLDDELSVRFGAKYFISANYGAAGGLPYAGVVMPPKPGKGFVRAGMRVLYDLPPGTHDEFFSGCNPERFQLTVDLLAGGRRLSATIEGAWLQGDEYTFATAYGSSTAQPLVDAPSPSLPSETPFRPRWNIAQPRQLAMPAVEWVDERRVVVVAAQVATGMPENHYILSDLTGDPLWFFLQIPSRKAALPALAIFTLEPTLIPHKENGDVDTAELPEGCQLGVGTPDDVPEWALPQSAPSFSNARYLKTDGALFVPASDWPEYLRPAEFVPELRYATVDIVPSSPPFPRSRWPDISGATSFRSCVVGAIHSTVIGDDVEFMAAVRAVDEHELPITSELRFDDAGGIEPGETALVKVTRTGLLVVNYNLVTGAVTTRALAPDVIGSDQCPWFDSGDMDASTAFCPQVLWGGVIDGKRCYAIRALRYERSVFLGSLLQDFLQQEAYWYRPDNYRGQIPAAFYPLYRTDLGFGPYIDRESPEELWWVVDDVVTRVTLPAGYIAAARPRVSSFAVEGQTSLAERIGTIYASMNIFSGPDTSHVKWQNYAMEEYLPPNTLMQQFAAISDKRVVYFIPADDDRNGVLVLQVFDGASVVDYATVSTPWVNGTHYTQASHQYPVYALTCYQHEVFEGEELVCPAGLILTVTSGPRGYALLSRDGGATWEPLLSAPNSFETDQSPGIPGHGYIFSGTALWSPEPGYPYVKEKVDG